MSHANKSGLFRAACWAFLISLLLSILLFAQEVTEATAQGRRLLDAGKPQEAMAYFELALSTNPTDPAALRGMGQALEWLGRFEQAAGFYRRAVAQAPGDIASWFALGKLQSWLGERQAAYQAFETALALAPDNPEIELSYAEILSWDPQRREQSVERYRNVLRRWPEFIPAQVGLARVQAWGGFIGQAETAYESVLAREPNQVDALLGKAEIARWTLRYLEAYELAQRAQRVASDDPRVLNALAETEILLGQYSLARERAEQLGAVAPDESLRLMDTIRNARRAYFDTGYQLRRDRKSPERNRLSSDSFSGVLSFPVASGSRLEFAFRPVIYRGESRRFSSPQFSSPTNGNAYGIGLDWILSSRWHSRAEIRREKYPGAPASIGGRFALGYSASDSERLEVSLERAVVADSLHSEAGTASEGVFAGQARSNLASLGFSTASFQHGMDFYGTVSSGFYDGRNLERNWRAGFDGGFGKTLRSDAPYIRAGYGITFFTFEHDQSALPGSGVRLSRSGGYFSPKFFLNNFAVLGVSGKLGRGAAWFVESSLGIQQVEDRFSRLDQARLSSTFQAQLTIPLTNRFRLDVSYNYLNVGNAYQRNLFRASLRTYF
ncbi:MAG: tetratricopeptide repeat protein [Acidobacteria bacterium]|nr:tetratricopeptide repeat protein [Acidobacteriota bacterium]